MAGSIIMFGCTIVCALIFLAIGLWALKRKDPMHFWAGSTIPPEEIRDIPAYNRANGILWLTYGGLFVLLAACSFLSVGATAIGLALACVLGLPILIFVYERIYNKYRA